MLPYFKIILWCALYLVSYLPLNIKRSLAFVYFLFSVRCSRNFKISEGHISNSWYRVKNSRMYYQTEFFFQKRRHWNTVAVQAPYYLGTATGRSRVNWFQCGVGSMCWGTLFSGEGVLPQCFLCSGLGLNWTGNSHGIIKWHG